MRLLVLEPYPDRAALLRLALRRNGVSVFDTQTATEAIEILSSVRVEALLLNVEPGVLEPAALLEHLRGLPLDGRPALVLTSSTYRRGDEHIVASLQLGRPSTFLRQPFTMRELYDEIADLVGHEPEQQAPVAPAPPARAPVAPEKNIRFLFAVWLRRESGVLTYRPRASGPEESLELSRGGPVSAKDQARLRDALVAEELRFVAEEVPATGDTSALGRLLWSAASERYREGLAASTRAEVLVQGSYAVSALTLPLHPATRRLVVEADGCTPLGALLGRLVADARKAEAELAVLLRLDVMRLERATPEEKVDSKEASRSVSKEPAERVLAKPSPLRASSTSGGSSGDYRIDPDWIRREAARMERASPDRVLRVLPSASPDQVQTAAARLRARFAVAIAHPAATEEVRAMVEGLRAKVNAAEAALLGRREPQRTTPLSPEELRRLERLASIMRRRGSEE